MKTTNTRVLKSPQQTSFLIGHDAHVVVHPRQPFSQVDHDMAWAVLVDPLTGDRLGLPMVGVSDLLLETDDGPVLVDFKTAARGSEPIEQQHEIQLACYAAMFRELTGDLEGGLEVRSLVKTKQPRIEVHRYERRSHRHMARLFAVIGEYLRAIELGEFNYRPGINCMFCDVRQPYIEWDAGRNQAAPF